MARNVELNATFKLLRFSGLGPFLVTGVEGRTYRTWFLVAYNLLIAVGLLYNMVKVIREMGKSSPSIHFNESVLVRTSFFLIDIIENFHHFFISIRSLVFFGRGHSLWLNLTRVNQMIRELNIEFNTFRFKFYLWTKTLIFLAVYIIFLRTDIILFPRPGSSGFLDYWTLCALPLFLNSILETAFGILALILYQRSWIVNEFLSSCMNHYKEEEFMLAARFDPLDSSHGSHGRPHLGFSGWKAKVTPFEGYFASPKHPPFMIMLKNPEEIYSLSQRRNLIEYIRKLKALHFGLYEVTDSLNSVFGYNLLFIFAISFFGCIINLYFVVIFHIKKYDLKKYVSCFSWMVYYIFRILHVITNANKARNEASKTQDLVHSFLSEINFADTAIQEELKSFCPQITECRAEFKAAGFFSIDTGSLFQFIAGVLSNVVFVIQFNKT